MIAGFLLWLPASAPAATALLTPDADTLISERYPENNFGAMTFFNSGTTQNYTSNRGLLRFDLAGALPSGAKIISATLTVEIVGQPDEPFPFARYNLHRALRAWGEGRGTNAPGGGLGQGSAAFAGEATWTHRFAFTTNTWSQPGAAAPADYVPTASSGVTAGGLDQSPYTLPATAQLAADLQLWLDAPETNFGWLLVCEQEQLAFTARRFGSREDASNAPRLEIQYLIPPEIAGIERLGSQINLRFLAQPDQSYRVEACADLNAADWQPLATLPTTGETNRVLVVDVTFAPRRFYRLVSH